MEFGLKIKTDKNCNNYFNIKKNEKNMNENFKKVIKKIINQRNNEDENKIKIEKKK